MIDLISNNKIQLKRICEKHLVKSLYLFGSAAKNQFDTLHSDLDFVVEFNPNINPIDYSDYFLDLLGDLKILFGKDVDLLSYRALKNRIMIAEIDHSKIELYAA
ncbi:MAG: putative nucleotidyltransferase [Parvicella sp.]|jgi:predicted nucleotidyltransferase